MTEATTSRKGVTPIGRVSHPHVFEPQVDKGSSKKTYSLVLMFDKTADISGLKAAYEAAIAEKWPNKKPKGLKSPFRDGDEVDEDGDRKKGPEYAGKVYITFRAKDDRKPSVVGPDLQPISKESGDFYPGCFAKASYSAFAYEYEGKNGVSFGLNNIQKVRDGERFDGRTSAEDDFSAIEDSSDKPMF
jgi:hypothetical protein